MVFDKQIVFLIYLVDVSLMLSLSIIQHFDKEFFIHSKFFLLQILAGNCQSGNFFSNFKVESSTFNLSGFSKEGFPLRSFLQIMEVVLHQAPLLHTGTVKYKQLGDKTLTSVELKGLSNNCICEQGNEGMSYNADTMIMKLTEVSDKDHYQLGQGFFFRTKGSRF